MQKVYDYYAAHRKAIIAAFAALVPQIQGTGELFDGVFIFLGLIGLIVIPNDDGATRRIYKKRR